MNFHETDMQQSERLTVSLKTKWNIIVFASQIFL